MRIFRRIIYYSQLLKRSQAAPPLRGQWIENASRQGRHYRLYSVMIRICVLTVLALLTCGLAHAGSYENGAKLYQHTDHLGSPVAGTDATGSVAWRERYTPYGEKLLKPDALNNQASFTGHIFDEPTGLTYMQARYYDPNIARFLSIDPVDFMQTGMPEYFNRYSYTFNDPINATDPDGRTVCPGSPECSARVMSSTAVTETSSSNTTTHQRVTTHTNEISGRTSREVTGTVKRLPQDSAGGVAAPISDDMVDNLLDVSASEEIGGRTVNVTSGTRTQAQQDAIRAAGNPRAARRSSHTYNEAVDINVDGVSDSDLADAANDTGNFARSNTYSSGGDVHLDQNTAAANQGRVCDYAAC